jgi:hypothetical protein
MPTMAPTTLSISISPRERGFTAIVLRWLAVRECGRAL